MEYYFQDEFGTDWLPTSNRFHAAREKQFSRKRKNMCLTLFFFFRRTERPDRTGTKSCLIEIDITVDGGGNVLRTNTLLLCRGMRKRFPFVVTWLARPKILDGPKHDFYLGTERTTMNSLVPFLPVPQGRAGLRHALMYLHIPGMSLLVVSIARRSS